MLRSTCLLGVALILSTGCSRPPLPPTAGTASSPPSDTVILIAIDGVRWQEVFTGVERDRALQSGLGTSDIVGPEVLMPTLHRLAYQEGAIIGAPDHGETISASGPNHLSMPGYTEMFTGLSPAPCGDNECSPTLTSTISDEVRALPHVRAQEVGVITSWGPIHRIATRSEEDILISTGQVDGKTRLGFTFDPIGDGLLATSSNVDPFPGDGSYRPDRFTIDLAIHYLTHVHPRFLFLGLGAPDEYAHRDDYPSYLRSLTETDQMLARLLATISRWPDAGARTTIFITTDHGRSPEFHNHGYDPESARVFLVAAGAGIKARGPVRAPEPRRLADIAPTIRQLLGLAPSDHPDSGKVLYELLE